MATWAETVLFDPSDVDQFDFELELATKLGAKNRLDRASATRRTLADDLTAHFAVGGDTAAWLNGLVADEANVARLNLLACQLNFSIAAGAGESSDTVYGEKSAQYRSIYEKRKRLVFGQLTLPTLTEDTTPAEQRAVKFIL